MLDRIVNFRKLILRLLARISDVVPLEFAAFFGIFFLMAVSSSSIEMGASHENHENYNDVTLGNTHALGCRVGGGD